MSTAADELFRLIQQNENGISDLDVQTHFGARYQSLAPTINTLLNQNKLQLFTANGALVYKAIHESAAVKFEGLGPEQILVYQVCEKAGDKGIWTRDIKMTTNIPQQSLTKTLKALEQRCLIKSVRSVTSKSKKLYMLFDLTPAKEVTGGPWYTDQEFDHEFLEELCRYIVQFVQSQGYAEIDAISEQVRISGISKVELSSEELNLVLTTLTYDRRLEEVPPSMLAFRNQSSSSSNSRSMAEAPCGLCPVSSHCKEGAVISPSSCIYLNQWLSMEGSSGDLF